MDVKAKARYVRMAPRKVRLVVGVIRGLSVAAARAQLRVMPKHAAEVVLKVLNSAVANAVHNHKMNASILRVRSVTVDGGPILYRHRPRAMGRSVPVRKRTSHITIIVSDEAVSTKK